MKKFLVFFVVLAFAFVNCDFVLGQISVEPRKAISGGDPYLEGEIGEIVAHKAFRKELIPVSIIIGDMMIDDYDDVIYVSNRYLYRSYFDIKKKIKLKQKTKEQIYGPFVFTFRDKTTGEAYIHVFSHREVVIILEYGGESVEYIFQPGLKDLILY